MPAAISATPSSITPRGPARSIRRPISGLTAAETKNPNENAPAVTPRSHPNSLTIGGENNENAGRGVTPVAIGTKVTATKVQPQKKGRRLKGHLSIYRKTRAQNFR